MIIEQADTKRYTLILKDSLLRPDLATGREQSTISYEYTFQVTSQALREKFVTIYVPWGELKATYRGKEKENAPPLNIEDVKRMSIMMRR